MRICSKIRGVVTRSFPVFPLFFRVLFPAIVLIHTFLFLSFWLTNRLFYSSANDYLAYLLKSRRDYLGVCLLVAGVLASWSVLQLAISGLSIASRPAIFLILPYGILSLAFLVFFYGSFRLLFRQAPSQWPRIGQLLGYYRLLLDVLLVWGIALAAALWLKRTLALHPGSSLAGTVRLALPFAAAYLLAWALPLALPPGSVYRGRLPEKPLVIAHRGASMLVPENTLAAARRAAGSGAYGVETDLHISLDGVPFLMHDDTLKRTTNVAAVFPGRENQRAETFTLGEVRRLDAGSWFLRQDPFRTIAAKTVSAEDLAGYPRLVVPTLDEELDLVRKSGMVLIFDLKQPPEGHPYHEQYFDLVFQRVKQAGIDPQIWYLVDIQHAKTVRGAAPQMKLAFGVDSRHPAPPGELAAQGFTIVNADFGLPPAWVHKYQKAGLWVNLFTVEEAWQFSRFWLMGINSITTSNAGMMLKLAQPAMSMAYRSYLALWAVLGLIGLGIGLFGFR